MGSILSARCVCGFDTSFMAGGGMRNFKVYCGAPGLCKDCWKFEIFNYLADDKCQHCGGSIEFYDNLELSKGGVETKGEVFSCKTEK